MRRSLRRLAAALPLLAAVACSDPIAPTLRTIDDVTYASSLGVDLSQGTRTSSGLYYRDLEVGTGATAEAGKTITIAYTGRLADGTQFDQRTTANPLTRPIGIGFFIRGWEEGIPGMKVGGRRQLVIPPALGYGLADNGPIPGNSVLVFEVQLIAVE